MDGGAPQLGPPATKGHFSVVRLPEAWFVACLSKELKKAPLGRSIQGIPLVLFRGADGTASALRARCPHRNVPLSAGSVKGGQRECAYHGWRFDTAGACRFIPGLVSSPDAARARHATRYATREVDGYIWVWSQPDVTPEVEPFRLPHLDDPAYTTVRREFLVEATMHAVIENALDVPHTAFLHGGLFRTSKKENEIDVVVRRFPD